MKTVGVTLPVPRILAERHGLRTVCFRAALQQAEDAGVYESRGEQLLGVRNAPPTVKAAVGLAEMQGLDSVLAATAGDLNDFRAALSVLHPAIETDLLPVIPRNEAATREAADKVLADVGVAAAGGSLRTEPTMLRRALKELERKALEGAFSSVEWRSFLLRIVRGNEVQLPLEDSEGRERAKVALLGNLSGPLDLAASIEVFGGRVVYDEWLQLAARLTLSETPYGDLAFSPLVQGLAQRSRELSSRLPNVDAVVLVVEPFCASSMEEVWFRAALSKPMLVLEAETLGNMDATRQLRLENFASAAFARRTSHP